MSKKIVVKLDLHDNKDKQKALKAVSVLVGIDAISLDMAARKMTVIGTVDPVQVVTKLRGKSWAAHIESIGPAKEPEPEKKPEEKKDGGDGAKKEGGEAKKEEGGGEAKKDAGDGAKKEEGDGAKKEEEGKKEGDGKKAEEGEATKKEEGGGGEKKPDAVAPLPFPNYHLPPPYTNMITADQYMNYMNQYRPPPPPYIHPYAPPPPQYYYVRNMSMEENPNSCAIC